LIIFIRNYRNKKVDKFIRDLKLNIQLEVELCKLNKLNKVIRILNRYNFITFHYQKKVNKLLVKSHSEYLDLALINLDTEKGKKNSSVKKVPDYYLCDKVEHVIKNCPMKKN